MYNSTQQGVNTYLYPQNQNEKPVYSYHQGIPTHQANPPETNPTLQAECSTYQPLNYYESQQIPQNQPLTQIQYTNTMVQAPPVQHQDDVLLVVQPIEIQVASPVCIKSKYPREIRCPSCGIRGVTNTKSAIGAGSWAMALALFCCGCWPCACFPFCLPDCMDTLHTCSSCGIQVGKRQFLCDD